MIDGVPLKTIKLRDLRRQIGYVSQEPVLFNTTIKKNILLGFPDGDDDQVIEALQKTNAWEFVQNADNKGIHANAGSGGTAFSGG